MKKYSWHSLTLKSIFELIETSEKGFLRLTPSCGVIL